MNTLHGLRGLIMLYHCSALQTPPNPFVAASAVAPSPFTPTLQPSLATQLYLHQLLETGGGSSSSMAHQPPPGVLRVLRSKACRGAIMFGDALSRDQCETLLQQLAATELCFMCAHGR